MNLLSLPPGHRLSSWKQFLWIGLMGLAGLVAVSSLVLSKAYSMGASGGWFFLLVFILAMACLGFFWPQAQQVKTWKTVIGFLLGSFLGLGLVISIVASRQAQSKLEVAFAAMAQEGSVQPFLDDGNCPAAMAILNADLRWISNAPALSMVSRADLWASAAAHGCVSGKNLHQVRQKLQKQAEQGSLETVGISRKEIVQRIYAFPGLESATGY